MGSPIPVTSCASPWRVTTRLSSERSSSEPGDLFDDDRFGCQNMLEVDAALLQPEETAKRDELHLCACESNELRISHRRPAATA
jgi:hypothetical protein